VRLWAKEGVRCGRHRTEVQIDAAPMRLNKGGGVWAEEGVRCGRHTILKMDGGGSEQQRRLTCPRWSTLRKSVTACTPPPGQVASPTSSSLTYYLYVCSIICWRTSITYFTRWIWCLDSSEWVSSRHGGLTDIITTQPALDFLAYCILMVFDISWNYF
jgi:hypothetical protein